MSDSFADLQASTTPSKPLKVSGPFKGAQNQKVLAKDIEVYHITYKKS